jgi:hypothetical protein
VPRAEQYKDVFFAKLKQVCLEPSSSWVSETLMVRQIDTTRPLGFLDLYFFS